MIGRVCPKTGEVIFTMTIDMNVYPCYRCDGKDFKHIRDGVCECESCGATQNPVMGTPGDMSPCRYCGEQFPDGVVHTCNGRSQASYRLT